MFSALSPIRLKRLMEVIKFEMLLSSDFPFLTVVKISAIAILEFSKILYPIS